MQPDIRLSKPRELGDHQMITGFKPLYVYTYNKPDRLQFMLSPQGLPAVSILLEDALPGAGFDPLAVRAPQDLEDRLRACLGECLELVRDNLENPPAAPKQPAPVKEKQEIGEADVGTLEVPDASN